MAPAVLLWLVGTWLAGVVLVWAGLRGRRVNGNPHCRQCGFDLVGTLPGGVMCPECGAGVKLAKYVRMGRRRRVVSLVAAGVPLVVLPLVPLGVAGFAAVTQTEVSRYKPLGLLLWEATTGGVKQASAAGRELYERQTSGRLTAKEYELVVRTLCETQRDEGRAWVPEFGRIVAQARLDGKLKEEALGDFQSASGVVDWRCRGRVRAGEKLAIQGTLREGRTAPGMETRVWEVLEGVTLGERVLQEGKLPVTFEKMLPKREDAEYPQFVEVVDASGAGGAGGAAWMSMAAMRGLGMGRGGWGWGGGEGVWFEVVVPADMKPGVYELEVSTAGAATPMDMIYQLGMGEESEIEGRPRWARATRRVRVEVTGGEEPAVGRVHPTAEVTAELATMLTPGVMLWDEGPRPMLNLTFMLGKPPVPLAYRLSCRLGDKTVDLGPVTSGRVPPRQGAGRDDDRGPFASMSGGQYNLMTELPREFFDKEVELVFTPDYALAERTVDLADVYAGEVVVPGVKLAVRTSRSVPGGMRVGRRASGTGSGTGVERAGGAEDPRTPAEAAVEEIAATVELGPAPRRSLLSWLFGR